MKNKECLGRYEDQRTYIHVGRLDQGIDENQGI